MKIRPVASADWLVRTRYADVGAGLSQVLYSVASVPNLLRAWTKVRPERRVDGSVESRIDAPAGVVVVRE